MWIKTENGEAVKPDIVIFSGDRVILNRGFKLIPETEEFPAHYEYETWDMSEEQYKVYSYMQSKISEQEDALIELAGIIAEIGG